MADFEVYLNESRDFVATVVDPDGDNWSIRWRAQPPPLSPAQPWDPYSGDYASGTQSAPRNVLFDKLGEWLIQAQAKDIHDLPGPISTVTVDVVEEENEPPADPSVACWVFSGGSWNQATQGNINQTVQVRATTTEPEGEDWYMRFRKWVPGTQPGNPTLWYGPFSGSQIATWEVFVDTEGTWHFFAQAKDSQDPPNLSNWSIVPFVVTAGDTTPPASPNTPSGPHELNANEVGRFATTTTDDSGQWQIQWWAGPNDPSEAVCVTVDGLGNPMWVGPDGTSSTYYANNALATISHSFPTGDCNWYIGAAARDAANNQVQATNFKEVSVLELGDTEAPSVPLTPWLNGLAYAGSDVILVTMCTDNSGLYKVKMQVQWVLDPLQYTHNTDYGDPVPSGREAEVTITLPTMVGFYRAKARAIDLSDNESDWSEWFLFYAAQPSVQTPTVPTVPELIDGDLVAGTAGTFSTVSYIGGGYQWQAKWEINGTDMGWTTTQDSGVAALTPVLFQYGEFSIRAKARNATFTQYESDWSNPFLGQVTDPRPLVPTQPQALDPLVASTPIRFKTSSWDNSGSYDLRWEINGQQQSWAQATHHANGTLAILTLTPNAGTLTLRAQARDNYLQESLWSPAATFIVEEIIEYERLTVHRVWFEVKENRSRR